MLKIRRSQDCLIFSMGMSYTSKTTSLYWNGPMRLTSLTISTIIQIRQKNRSLLFSNMAITSPHVLLHMDGLGAYHLQNSTSFQNAKGPISRTIFSIIIQIQWKFHFVLNAVVLKLSLWNVVHGTTAMLLQHVHNFVAIWYHTLDLHKNPFSIEFESRWKNRPWNGHRICIFSDKSPIWQNRSQDAS